MKVNEAISRSSAIYPSDEDKTPLYEWLGELEKRICLELNGADCAPITASDGEKELCAPDAYCEIYPLYLMMKRELLIGDKERYSFFLSVFDAAYSAFVSYVCRTSDKGEATRIKTL